MKRTLTLCLAITAMCTVMAQNVQFHYDLGRTLSDDLENRPAVTTTVESFKLDKWGSTFLFVDLDYYHDGVAGTYWEIAREFNVTPDKRWAAHVEYNGGMTSNRITDMSTRYQHAVLFGPAWNWASADFSRTLSLQAMYKYYFKGKNPWNKPYSGFQATAVWGAELANHMFTFSGFIDCWYDPSVKGKWITISEPQLWFNISALKGCEGINLSLGTEVEVSNNFIFDKNGNNNHFYAIPTLAAKWTFK